MKQERQNKMDSKIQEILSQKIFELTMEIQQDYGLITVNSTRLAPDMSYIDVFVSSIKNQEILCKTLATYAQELKESLKNKIVLRKMPIIRFRYDKSMETENKMLAQINALDIPNITE
jgi:ribosome-binding factor A